MRQTFELTGNVLTIRSVKNGLIITVMEPAINKLAKPEYVNVAIWGPKAEAIRPKLERNARFNFKGDITKNQRGKKTFTNYTVCQWQRLATPRKKYQERQERNDDWYVPEPENRDSRRNRLNEGFNGRL